MYQLIVVPHYGRAASLLKYRYNAKGRVLYYDLRIRHPRVVRVIIRTLRSALRCQRDLALENLVLRQQLAVRKHRHPRPRLTDADRLFRVLLSRMSIRAAA